MHSTARIDDTESDLVYGLRQRVKDLEALLGVTWAPPRVLRLTITEAKVLGMLVKRPSLCSMNAFFTAIWGEYDEPVSAEDLVRVFVHRLRKKLAPHGVSIGCVRSQGYFLIDGDKLDALYAPGERTKPGKPEQVSFPDEGREGRRGDCE